MVQHRLSTGAVIEINGYYYLGTLHARSQLNGKHYGGELIPPNKQSDKTRKSLADRGHAGYWTFDAMAIPEDKAQEIIIQAKAERDAKIAQDQATLNTAITSGEAFRTAEIADQYEAKLGWARRSKTGEGYAEWVVFGYAGDNRITVEREAIRQVVDGRKSCGSFPGCSNTAWEITEDEWDTIIKLSDEIKSRKAQAKRDFEAAEAADIQHKIDTGYCFYCETWCDGDCGHYSVDPMVQFKRDLSLAQREANYGIQEG